MMLKKERKVYRLFAPILLVAMLSLKSFVGTAQTTVIREWDKLGESSAMIDVSYRVIRCAPSDSAQVHLQIFNENPTAQTAHFDIVITDAASNQSFTTVINKNVAIAALVQAECVNDPAMNDLKIMLPASYDPNNITATITFLP